MAADLERTADAVRSGAGIEWVGVAADRYRDRLADHTRQVDEAREELLGTAAALDHLADTLEERQAAIRRAMQLVDDAVDDARRTVTRLAGDALDDAERAAKRAAQEVLDRARSLPLPGAPEWTSIAKTIGDLW
ncbi:hypothetical protein Celf_3245 [Cellulomonas fimi ATCC 484]|uniref:Uncharacterized protein n=2 Tax=Cellulomonas fimi TaxID=1708 RepID=F4H0J0_CELFA|nr:hypothetical protein Celf_3245 [Cellulomonas fimi ATCC 484]VEH36021.1 Uncharacterised protein [Cellulomonas fimi]